MLARFAEFSRALWILPFERSALNLRVCAVQVMGFRRLSGGKRVWEHVFTYLSIGLLIWPIIFIVEYFYFGRGKRSRNPLFLMNEYARFS